MTATIRGITESGPGVLAHPGPWPTLTGGSTVEKRTCSVEGCDKAPKAPQGYCWAHYQRLRNHGDVLWTPPTTEDRFWSRVDKRGPDECWSWLGRITEKGYGAFVLPTRTAHRFSWVLAHGSIPPRSSGLMLDHLCHTRDAECVLAASCPHRRCVNPAHLELVSAGENSRRAHKSSAARQAGGRANAAKTHCPKGHPYSGENLFLTSNGGRACRICQRAAVRKCMQRTRRAA